jgi:hypothetical protein
MKHFITGIVIFWGLLAGDWEKCGAVMNPIVQRIQRRLPTFENLRFEPYRAHK